jgi:16S rRNA (cytosine967-C5)-methyltransferase
MKKKPGNISRKKVALILKDVIEDFISFDDAFQKATKNQNSMKLSNKDKAFIYLLSSSVLRYLTQIDSTIDHLLKEPIKKLPSNPKMALRIGVAQIFILETPTHAAVNTSVDSATVKWRALVNAVMRNVAREEEKYKNIFNDSPKVPKWLLDRWKKNWPNDYLNFIECIQDIHPHIERAVKSNISKWQIELNAELMPNNVLRLRETGLIADKKGYDEGEWWVQDYSSQLPVKCLNIKENDEILDLCAAPGGKTAQMISLGATVHSIDFNKTRIKRFKENMKRLKLNTVIENVDILTYETERKWNKILLDVPCSSTGTIRKNPDILYSKNERSVSNLVDLQKKLLEKSWPLLSKGGQLIYCNCSLEKEEGEIQIMKFLQKHKDCKIDKISSDLIDDIEYSVTDEGWLRILPNGKESVKNRDGFFIASLKKVS